MPARDFGPLLLVGRRDSGFRSWPKQQELASGLLGIVLALGMAVSALLVVRVNDPLEATRACPRVG